MRNTPLSFVLTAAFCTLMLAVGLWMAIAPRSFLAKRWQPVSPSADPDSRRAQFICRVAGVVFSLVIVIYAVAVLTP